MMTTTSRILNENLLICLLVSISCAQDIVVTQPCRNIPQGGCPWTVEDPCLDVACTAIYTCSASQWTLERQCSNDGGMADISVSDGSADHGLQWLHDANIDARPGAYGGPGCIDLEAPDCSLGLALACGVGCCGCEDLYICEGGGWQFWGACSW